MSVRLYISLHRYTRPTPADPCLPPFHIFLFTCLATGKTSWADEMDELPTARESPICSASPFLPSISPACSPLVPSPTAMPRESSYRRGGDFLSSVPDRAERDRMGPASFERPERSYPPRVELPLPDKPPFTAFIGNLSYDVTESEIADFFAPSNVSLFQPQPWQTWPHLFSPWFPFFFLQLPPITDCERPPYQPGWKAQGLWLRRV